APQVDLSEQLACLRDCGLLLGAHAARGREAAPRSISALPRARKQHVLEDRQAAQLARDLERAHQAGLRALVGAQPEKAASLQRDAPWIGLAQPGEDVAQQRRD